MIRVLVTTSVEETWPEGEPILFLGEWCRRFSRRHRWSGLDAEVIDYKDGKMLSRFTSQRGKIVPSRITSVSAKKQRELAKAIKKARLLALIPNYGSFMQPVYTETMFAKIALLVLVLGVLGGVYPAWRAGGLRPIEALRYE